MDLNRDGSKLVRKVSLFRGRFSFGLRTVSVFILVFIFSSACAKVITKKVCIRNACINVEVADTDFKRQKGLMFRESLSDKEGMLFIFDAEEKYSFWMQNMLIPLDFIWISKDKRVVDISRDVKPCTDTCDNLIPKEKVKYVLEVNAGLVNKHKIKLGDKVSLDTKGLLN